ncbi:methyltransferase domain-containing protein [Phaeovulum sp. W22_SRMD_FR3]|uniref:methyltransferase domain-containing protein n=1 Tax=Phaeovulum sp. W22_SRMD_FR3 TaxID=3240274 RepID=UPI003F9CDCD2
MSGLTQRVARSFGRSAPSYDAAATAQKAIAAEVFGRLMAHRGPEPLPRVLEAGYGSGHFTRHLLRLPIGTLWLNDLASPPLAACPQAVYLPGDIRSAVLPADLDLVASTSMIQWLPDPKATLAHLGRAVRPGGWMAISGFGPGHFPELRQLGSAAAAPSCLSAAALAALLPPGWQLREARDFTRQLWFSTPMQVLQHLRATGVNGCARRCWSRAALNAFCAGYSAAFGTAEGVPLTYCPTVIIAQKR